MKTVFCIRKESCVIGDDVEVNFDLYSDRKKAFDELGKLKEQTIKNYKEIYEEEDIEVEEGANSFKIQGFYGDYVYCSVFEKEVH